MTAPYWTDKSYLDAVCLRVPGHDGYVISPKGYPLLRLPQPNGALHFACPPGFLSPDTPENFAGYLDFVQKTAARENALSAFLQYRGGDTPHIDNPHHQIEKRTLVHVPLCENDEDMLAACRRDTRNRLRQIQRKNSLDYDLEYNDMFFDLYCQIATKQGFSASYQYTAQDMKNILAAEGIHPVSIYDDAQNHLGGAIMGHVTNGLCDYILSAYDKNFPNAGRAVLWGCLLAARDLGYSHVNLGGGVKEGDSLYDFKMSFGGQNHPFFTIKIVFDAQKYEKLYDVDMATVDLSGRFPPQ